MFRKMLHGLSPLVKINRNQVLEKRMIEWLKLLNS